jgi:hypothetical protein
MVKHMIGIRVTGDFMGVQFTGIVIERDNDNSYFVEFDNPIPFANCVNGDIFYYTGAFFTRRELYTSEDLTDS